MSIDDRLEFRFNFTSFRLRHVELRHVYLRQCKHRTKVSWAVEQRGLAHWLGVTTVDFGELGFW